MLEKDQVNRFDIKQVDLEIKRINLQTDNIFKGI